MLPNKDISDFDIGEREVFQRCTFYDHIGNVTYSPSAVKKKVKIAHMVA